MTSFSEPEQGYVRSLPAAVLVAIPGITFLTFYLWLGVAMLASAVLGSTGSPLLGGIAALVLAVPAAFVTWRIILNCIDVERRTP